MDNLNERIAEMWAKSRIQAGKSQEYVANALGVSRKTIQNWESGIACPNICTCFKWFDCLGVPMYPYIMELLYPAEIAGINAGIDMAHIREALHTYIDELDDLHARELLFLLYGSHGSSTTGTLDMITAYLHLPLTMKVCICDHIISNYEMAQFCNILSDNDHVMPQTRTLKRYADTARQAIFDGKQTYTMTEKEDF